MKFTAFLLLLLFTGATYAQKISAPYYPTSDYWERKSPASFGFDSIQFKGKPLMWSPSAPSGNMYFINTQYMKLVCDESFYMEMTDWKQIPDQPFDKVAQIVCALNLTIRRAVCQKVLTSIAA